MKKQYIKPQTELFPMMIKNLLETASIPGGGTGHPDAKEIYWENIDIDEEEDTEHYN